MGYIGSKKLIKPEILILIIGGLLLWNTWVFGWLNHGAAGYTSMSISELNVAGQPFALFFSATEWLSGLFLLVGGAGLIFSSRAKSFMLTALILTALIGALTIFDAMRPVDCNSYHNPVCASKMAAADVSDTDKEHVVESRISALATVLLALDLVAYSLDEKLPRTELVIVVALAIGVIATTVIGGSLFFDSISQRVWNVLVSLDFLFVAYRLALNGFSFVL